MARKIPAFIQKLDFPLSLPQPISGYEHQCFESAEVYGRSSVAVTEALCRCFAHMGYGQVALLGPDKPDDQIYQQKVSAYSRFVTKQKRPYLCSFVGESAGEMDELAESWAEHRGELAVVCYDDAHAFRFMTAMHKLGLSAPADYAIVGYNNSPISTQCDPALSTVSQDFAYIAKWLLNAALAQSEERISQSDNPPPLKLIVRDSCGSKDRVTDNLRSDLPELDIACEATQQELCA